MTAMAHPGRPPPPPPLPTPLSVVAAGSVVAVGTTAGVAAGVATGVAVAMGVAVGVGVGVAGEGGGGGGGGGVAVACTTDIAFRGSSGKKKRFWSRFHRGLQGGWGKGRGGKVGLVVGVLWWLHMARVFGMAAQFKRG